MFAHARQPQFRARTLPLLHAVKEKTELAPKERKKRKIISCWYVLCAEILD